MDKNSNLQCIDVARAALGEPAKPAGQRPEVNEAWFVCNQHEDDHPSLKVNTLKNAWMDGPCNASGNAWELAGFLQAKSYQWESYTEADRKEISEWLRARGLLGELPEKVNRARPRKVVAYPVLREFIYRVWETGAAVAKRVRYNTQQKQNRFAWFHSEETAGGAGEWKAGLPQAIRLPLYLGMPAPKDGATFLRYSTRFNEATEIYLTEGEHDADACADIGLGAVTGGGTSSLEILRRNVSWFRDRNVVILAHADAAGLRFAEQAAVLLDSAATSIRIVKLAECWPMPIKDLGDAVEGMNAGGYSAETIHVALQIARNRAPAWKAATGAEVLDAVYNYIRRFTKVTEAQARACTLWVAAAFIYQRWDFTSYLHIYSAERGEGKSTLVNVLAALLGGLNVLIRPTLPALYTDLEEHPGRVQCMDEIDKMFCGKREYDGPILAYLTAGFQRHRKVLRVQIAKGVRRNEEFETFCPKILAGRYEETLDDPTRDRCIPIRMEMAIWADRVKRWVFKFHLSEGEEIGAKLEVWCQSIAEKAAKIDVWATTEVGQRVIDIWEPLLAIAELASEDWLEHAKASILDLHTGPRGQHDSRGMKLLKAILTVKDSRPDSEGIFSSGLATALPEINEEYREFGKGQKPISATQIARILAPYEIKPARITIDGQQDRGYLWSQFADAWCRYTPNQDTLRHFDKKEVSYDKSLFNEADTKIKDTKTDDSNPIGMTQATQAKTTAKWFRLSELRVMRGPGPRISILGPGGVQDMPSLGTGRPGRLITERGHETCALDTGCFETGLGRMSGMEQAHVSMTGVERRGK
jgi:hypothetical protein